MTSPIGKEYWPIEKLSNWENNPRTITKDNFDRLKEQIKELGEYKPLLITKDGLVLGGNMRLRAYRDLGIKQCWVSVVEAETEEQKLKYALSDNDQAGETNTDTLANLIGNIQEIDLTNYAVYLKPPTPINELLDQFKEVVEDEVPEVSSEPAISKLGDVYQLGRHRLMVGDSTKIEDVEKLMDGKKADMVFTSPPYNVDLGYATYNDNKTDSEYYIFIFNVLKLSYEIIKDGRFVCWNIGTSPDTLIFDQVKAIKKAGFKYYRQIIWKKS